MSDIHQRILALGLDFGPDQIKGSAALFAPLLPAIDEASVVRDQRYGPDERNRLDVFGAAPGAGKPVVIFIHGGGFIMGDKGAAGQPFYNNVGGWAARNGWIGVTATYRLAPQNPWPAGAEDMAGVVAWARANIAAHGGDPAKIVLIGQSAGAAHVASYVGHALFRETANKSLAGAIMMSGLYDIATLKPGHFEKAYYGEDSALYAERSSLQGLPLSTVPCLFTVAENDPELFQRQAAAMVRRWVEARGQWPQFGWLEGQNHITPVHQIGTPVDEVGPRLAGFIRRVTA
jgi:triacylglycerol lipase